MKKFINKNPFIIAEVSANHNGSIQRAKNTIKAAHKSGADAVKIQTYTADTMTIDSSNEDFKIKTRVHTKCYVKSLRSLSSQLCKSIPPPIKSLSA